MYIKVQEFLAEYPMSKSQFYKLAGQGFIPLTKVGRSTWIKRADAEAWAATLTVRRGAPANDN